MAINRRPNTPYDPEYLHNPPPQDLAASETPHAPVDLSDGVQGDPPLIEEPVNNTRIALITVAIAIVLGIVFYALNNSTLHQQASLPAPATGQNSASTSPPTAPSGMRTVLPRANDAPGTTTGSAPASK